MFIPVPALAIGAALVILSGIKELNEKAESSPKDRDELLAKLEEANSRVKELETSTVSSEELEQLKSDREKLRNKLAAFRAGERARKRNAKKPTEKKADEKPEENPTEE